MSPQDFEGPNLRWRRWVRAQGHAYLPETHKIVATMPDGRVTLTTPSYEALYFMCGPGGYWNDYPFGFLAELVRRKTCPVLQWGRPCTREAAERFVKAMQWGNRPCAEAWDIIAQHDVARQGGTAIEIIPVTDIPSSREFRDFWRRSTNGSPIYVFDAPAVEFNKVRRAA